MRWVKRRSSAIIRHKTINALESDAHFSMQSGENINWKVRGQAKVRPAVEELLEVARRAAQGSGKSYSYDDVFGAEE